MTLQELVDDVMLEARNNNIAESEKLSKHQIILWINSYRVMLIKQKLDKHDPIDDMFTQTIRMHIDKIENDPGHIEYIGDKELPKLINTKTNNGIIQVKDAYGNVIQLGTELKMKFQKYRKYTCKEYIAYKKSNRLYVEGDANTLEYIDVKLIAEDPTSLQDCYNIETDDYPLPMHMWHTIKDLIFKSDLGVMFKMVSDNINNSNDNTQINK